MRLKDTGTLALTIALCNLAGIIGSLFTSSSISTWYSTLIKPFFSPPNWLFAPVWISLYTLMGISLYLVLNKKNNLRALAFFFAQLILNTLWSILFFGLRSPYLAFIEIVVLWFVIALTITEFRRIDKRATYLLIPYILWVSFAAILNFSIWRLNP